MKSKTIERKLLLSKETIVNLNGSEMKGIHAGIEQTLQLSCLYTACPDLCPSFPTTERPYVCH